MGSRNQVVGSSTFMLLASAAAAFAPSAASASAVQFDGVTPYQQNFDSLASTGTPAWADDSTIPAWYAWTQTPGGSPTTYTADNGQNVIGLLSEGSDATDRALGSRNANGTGEIRYGVVLQNKSGAVINQINVAYLGEQWRQDTSGQPTATFDDKLTVTFKIQSTDPATQTAGTALSTSGFTATSGLNFDSPQPQMSGTTGATPLNGDDPANQTAVSGSISGITWNPGQFLILRWSDLNITGNDNTLAIDNLSVSPVSVPEPATASLLGLGLLLPLSRRNRRFASA